MKNESEKLKCLKCNEKVLYDIGDFGRGFGVLCPVCNWGITFYVNKKYPTVKDLMKVFMEYYSKKKNYEKRK